VSFDPRHLREDVYGSHDGGEEHTRRVFLLYVDGRHYDALVWQPLGGGGPQQTLFSTQDDNAWVRARDFCLQMHQELARQGRCALQPQWRTNNHLKLTTAQDRERMRQERVQADAAQVQVVQDTVSALEHHQQHPPQDTSGGNDDDNTWECAVCTFINQAGLHCGVCHTASSHASQASEASSARSSSARVVEEEKVAQHMAQNEGFACTTCTAWNDVTHATRCVVCRTPREGVYAFGEEEQNDDDEPRAPLPQRVDQLIGGPSSPSAAHDAYMLWHMPAPATAPVRRPRRVLPRWECIHCSASNAGSARKCQTCQMRRATT
jgi:hypothetical protein